MRRALIGLAVLVAVGIVALFGYRWMTPAVDQTDIPQPTGEIAPPTVLPRGAEAGEVVTVATPDNQVAVAGATPMAQRVAVVGLLNKRNGETWDLRLRPGEATRIGNAVVRLRACERTAPWEQDQYTGAFVQLIVRGPDAKWRRAFSGWLFKERPNLNVVQHPIYDVWAKSCTMTFPETGADTVPAAAANRSSAKKSGGGTSSAPAPAPSPASPPTEAPSASDNSTE